jgi:hypothetical protein
VVIWVCGIGGEDHVENADGDSTCLIGVLRQSGNCCDGVNVCTAEDIFNFQYAVRVELGKNVLCT